MKFNKTTLFSGRLSKASRFLPIVFFALFFQNAWAQITTVDCTNTYDYCSLDTVKLAPANTTDFTNFVWYAGSVDPANEVTPASAAGFNVDPTRLDASNDSLYISAPGGTYILTAEYSTPSGCATKNDTLVINFLSIPDLVTQTDTICEVAGESIDLATLATDNNGVAGNMVWYPTLLDALAESDALGSTTVSPSSTTKYYVRKNTTATDAEGSACYDLDSLTLEVRCLNLGNVVWYDTNNDGIYDSGTEDGIENVTVELFLDADGNGLLENAEQTAIADVQTTSSGLYLFEGLAEGKYFVGIPSSELSSGGDLENLSSSTTSMNNMGVLSELPAPAPDATSNDTDDNGQLVEAGFYTGGVMTTAFTMLNYQDEPVGEMPDNSTIDDADDNLTVDFGFYGMSIGSLVFMDVDNDAIFGTGDMGIAGVTVNLYPADGTTLLQTTTTDANGNYLFTGLPEGDYIVGVETGSAALAGKESSDDIASSATPKSMDNDDNGVVATLTEIRSNPITMDAGLASTGESDQALTSTGMSDPTVTDNPNTPSNNSELHVDFGFKTVCPAITNALGAQAVCSGESGSNISIDVNVDSLIQFVRFDELQAGTDMYAGGTTIGSTVDPTGSGPYTAVYTFNPSDFPNPSTPTPDTFYVYGILANVPAAPQCRPFGQIRVIVNPIPTASSASLTLCETTLGGGMANFSLNDADVQVLNGQTGMTVTYHASSQHADDATFPLSSPYSAATGTTIFARVESGAGCHSTSEVSLTVNAAPDFTISIPTTCPGDEPTILLNNLTNGNATLSMMQLNAEGFSPYQSDTVFETADGVILGATNTVTVRNENECETSKDISVPGIVPLACPPVNVNIIRSEE